MTPLPTIRFLLPDLWLICYVVCLPKAAVGLSASLPICRNFSELGQLRMEVFHHVVHSFGRHVARGCRFRMTAFGMVTVPTQVWSRSLLIFRYVSYAIALFALMDNAALHNRGHVRGRTDKSTEVCLLFIYYAVPIN